MRVDCVLSPVIAVGRFTSKCLCWVVRFKFSVGSSFYTFPEVRMVTFLMVSSGLGMCRCFCFFRASWNALRPSSVPVDVNAVFRRACLVSRAFASVFGSRCWYLSEASLATDSGWDSRNKSTKQQLELFPGYTRADIVG